MARIDHFARYWERKNNRRNFASWFLLFLFSFVMESAPIIMPDAWLKLPKSFISSVFLWMDTLLILLRVLVHTRACTYAATYKYGCVYIYLHVYVCMHVTTRTDSTGMATVLLLDTHCTTTHCSSWLQNGSVWKTVRSSSTLNGGRWEPGDPLPIFPTTNYLFRLVQFNQLRLSLCSQARLPRKPLKDKVDFTEETNWLSGLYCKTKEVRPSTLELWHAPECT